MLKLSCVNQIDFINTRGEIVEIVEAPVGVPLPVPTPKSTVVLSQDGISLRYTVTGSPPIYHYGTDGDNVVVVVEVE